MTNTKTKVDKILNDEKVMGTLISLYGRWQDEKEFEDWKDYEKAMSKLVKYPFKKGTKRPFGFVIEVDKMNIHIHLKIRGEMANLVAKIA